MLFTAATSPITTSDLHCRCRSQYRQCSLLLYHSFPSHHHQCSSLPLPVPPPSMILAATADPATARAPHDQKAIPLAALPVPQQADNSVLLRPQSLDQPTPQLAASTCRQTSRRLRSIRPPVSSDQQTTPLATPASRQTSRRLRSLRPPVARPADDSAHQSPMPSRRLRSLRPPVSQDQRTAPLAAPANRKTSRRL